MRSYDILRFLLGPVVRPVAAALDRLRTQRIERQFQKVGAGVVFAGEPTVIGGTGISLGDGSRIMRGVFLWATERGSIAIGARTHLGEYSFVVADARVEIGSDVLIAPFCYIQDAEHGFARTDVVIREQPSTASPIVIEDDVWIGAHSIILRGVRVGHGSVIGANSVVTADVAPYSVVAGSPARLIRSRIADEVR